MNTADDYRKLNKKELLLANLAVTLGKSDIKDVKSLEELYVGYSYQGDFTICCIWEEVGTEETNWTTRLGASKKSITDNYDKEQGALVAFWRAVSL